MYDNKTETSSGVRKCFYFDAQKRHDNTCIWCLEYVAPQNIYVAISLMFGPKTGYFDWPIYIIKLLYCLYFFFFLSHFLRSAISLAFFSSDLSHIWSVR